MKHRAFIAAIALLASLSSADVFAARAAKQKPAARDPDMCVVPPGAQPLLPAKLLPGMGTIKDFAVTTKSEDARIVKENSRPTPVYRAGQRHTSGGAVKG